MTHHREGKGERRHIPNWMLVYFTFLAFMALCVLVGNLAGRH